MSPGRATGIAGALGEDTSKLFSGLFMAPFFIHNPPGHIDPWVVSQQAEDVRNEHGGNKPNQQLEVCHQTVLRD